MLNIDKIKSLGWEPKMSLREGIESTYDWYKKSIGYEKPVENLNIFSKFMKWMG